jgi:cytochrome c-type biogenesis protein CcmH
MKRIGILTAFALHWVFAASAPAATVSEITKQLICQCGCRMVVATCYCAKAEEMRSEIRTKLDRGSSSAEIVAQYVATYGEKVLAAPTKKGFNLTAWVAPILAVAAGLILLWFVVREFVRRGREAAAMHSTEEIRRDAGFHERVNDELRDYL